MELKVEYIPIEDIKPYENNAKLHPAFQIEQIKKSIQEFGFADPCALWRGEVVEGHGRLLAAQQMGMKVIPCIKLDTLTDEQRRAYGLIHNKLTMNSDFDIDLLAEELDSIGDIDMGDFGFSLDLGTDEEENAPDVDSKYTDNINAPQYEIKGETPNVAELVDTSKAKALEEEIKASDIGDKQVKDFLLMAAKRHYVFNYAKIAEYYANASADVQELMERSALVIIDYNDAILNGYTSLAKNIGEMGGENEE